MIGMSGPYGPASPALYYPSTVPSAYPPPYGTYPFLQPPQRRVSARQVTGLALGIVGIVLVVVSMLGSWFSASINGNFSGIPISVQEDFGLFSVSARAMGFGMSMGYDVMPQVGQIFLITALLLLSGLVSAVVSLALGFPRGGTGLRTAGLVTGVAAGVLVALAPIYLMLALPGAGNQGQSTPPGFVTTGNFNQFWGSGTVTFQGITMQMTWGAGWAWYLAFAAAAFVLAGGVLMALGRPQPMVPWAYAPPYAPPTPPVGPVGPTQTEVPTSETPPVPMSPEPRSPPAQPPSDEGVSPQDSSPLH